MKILDTIPQYLKFKEAINIDAKDKKLGQRKPIICMYVRGITSMQNSIDNETIEAVALVGYFDNFFTLRICEIGLQIESKISITIAFENFANFYFDSY